MVEFMDVEDHPPEMLRKNQKEKLIEDGEELLRQLATTHLTPLIIPQVRAVDYSAMQGVGGYAQPVVQQVHMENKEVDFGLRPMIGALLFLMQCEINRLKLENGEY